VTEQRTNLQGRRWGWVGGEFQNERVEETRE
jgi:hypothetical protein